MALAATMNDDAYKALRDAGIGEEPAMRVAKAIPNRDEVATKADLAELRAAIPRAENFAARGEAAAKSDVAVLQTEMKTVEGAIVRIDKTLARIEETLVELKESNARMDEKINSTRKLLFAVFVPLLVAMAAAQLGIIGLLIQLVLNQSP